MASHAIALPSELTSMIATSTYKFRHTPEAKPRAPDGLFRTHAAEICRFDAAYCRLFPIGNACRRKRPNNEIRSHCRPHRSTLVQRTCACSSRALCLGASPHRVLQGERKFSQTGFMMIFRMTIPANAQNKSPRVWRPEGVRVASGDRGDRSPQGNRSVNEKHERMLSIAHARQYIAISTRRQTDLSDLKQHE